MSIRDFFASSKKPADTEQNKKKLKLSNNNEDNTTPEAITASTPSTASVLLDTDGKSQVKLASETSISCSSEWTPYSELEGEWRDVLCKEPTKPYFTRLTTFINNELRANNKRIFPPVNKLFTAFNLCQFNDVKVVIIGQDPYHGPNQAHGMCFSVQRGVPPPPSLKNIYKEAIEDVGIRPPQHGNLEYWAKQGVLLLNVVMTVRQGEANSHQYKGWEQFTDATIDALKKKQGIVYLLWGKSAQEKCKSIDKKKNTIIATSHPSPLGAYAKVNPFITSKCFSKCNAALIANGKTEIDWNIPN